MSNRKLFSLPDTGLRGQLQLPGDKSISHRALLIAAISQGNTHIKHFLRSDDCLSTLQAIRDLGVAVDETQDELIVHGRGLMGLQKPQHALNMGNSGTTTRLIMGLLAGQAFDSSLYGDASLQKRPMRRVSDPLKQMGADIQTSTSGTLPVMIHGRKLHAADIQLQIASAQVKSALILAALQADKPSVIVEKLPTRDHTERMLRQFGADVRTDADQLTITVSPQPTLEGQVVQVPGDMSSAAFFLAAATIVPNSDITLRAVNMNPTRSGILSVLFKMGANIQVHPLETSGEPLADIRVKYAELTAIEIGEKEIPSVIDELPLIALLAACAKGQSKITGAHELRLKETDRIATVAAELRKLGVSVTELVDGFLIQGCPSWQIKDRMLDSYGDHRIGMMMAIAALRSKANLFLKSPEAVAVSYPTFFSDLQSLIPANSGVF